MNNNVTIIIVEGFIVEIYQTYCKMEKTESDGRTWNGHVEYTYNKNTDEFCQSCKYFLTCSNVKFGEYFEKVIYKIEEKINEGRRHKCKNDQSERFKK